MPSEPPEPRGDAVRRIAILRANGIGDLVFALPALDALRARYPDAEMVLLGRRWHAELLSRRPGPVDRVELIPDGLPADAPTDAEEADRFFERMRHEHFDLALQMHGGGRASNPFVGALGASTTAGLRARGAPPLDRWTPYVYHQHEIARYLEVAALVGAAPVTIEPRLSVTGADLEASRRAIPADGRPVAVLHPGATDPRRHWPPDAFAVVGDHLAARGIRVVVTGVADERPLADHVTGAMRAEAESACGAVGLQGLVGLLARASIVIANDTGPLHLAAAVGTPTVGIYWAGNLVNGGPLLADRARHVTSWRLDCPVCGSDATRTRCAHNASFVADAPPAGAIATADDLLERHGLVPDGLAVDDAVRTRADDRRRGSSGRPRRAREASWRPPGGTRRTA